MTGFLSPKGLWPYVIVSAVGQLIAFVSFVKTISLFAPATPLNAVLFFVMVAFPFAIGGLIGFRRADPVAASVTVAVMSYAAVVSVLVAYSRLIERATWIDNLTSAALAFAVLPVGVVGGVLLLKGVMWIWDRLWGV
jgi:hypothetical protein